MDSFQTIDAILRREKEKGENYHEVGPGHILSLESEIITGSYQTVVYREN